MAVTPQQAADQRQFQDYINAQGQYKPGTSFTGNVTPQQAQGQAQFQNYINAGGSPNGYDTNTNTQTTTNTGGNQSTGPGDSAFAQLQKMLASGGLNPSQMSDYQRMLDQQNIPNMQNNLRNDIGSGWDQYTNSLNDIGNQYLPEQRASQENIVNSQLSQGQNTIESQKAKSLRDISSNIQNAFQAGNQYLGARGAGDSSAGNQYSYAVQQQASKQTGQLNEFTNTQLANLQSTHDQQLQQIGQWFSQQQQAIKQAVATGQLQKQTDIQNLSRQLLDQAMQAANEVKSNTQNQYNALLGWAASNSQNMGQLQQNIASIPQAMGGISTSGLTSSGLIPAGAGSFGNENDLFKNR